jgi:tetrahydromethanopterin S-methyltransferase subunit G
VTMHDAIGIAFGIVLGLVFAALAVIAATR